MMKQYDSLNTGDSDEMLEGIRHQQVTARSPLKRAVMILLLFSLSANFLFLVQYFSSQQSTTMYAKSKYGTHLKPKQWRPLSAF